jgi:outer membrane protein assembly factor BamB
MNTMDQNQKITITRSIAIISGLFTIMVALLLLLNYLQISSDDPLESETMELLIERMREEPDNEELIQEIRQFDLLARKAFFTSQWQINTGRYLMLFGAILFVVALRFYYSLTSKIEEPESQSEDDRRARILSQRWIIGAGGFLFLVAFLSSFAVRDHLGDYIAEASDTGEVIQSPEDEGIEVVEVTESSAEDRVTAEPVDRDQQVTESSEVEDEEVSREAGQTGRQPTIATPPAFPSLTEIRENSTGFRGFLGQGVSYSRNIPVDWDGGEGKNILWKVQIPKPGYNSPVIWKNRLFVAGADNQGGMVYCFDRHTGQILWQREVTDIPGSPDEIPNVTGDTGLSAPSVTTNGINVYAIFANGDIAAFTNDGKYVWGRNLGMPNNHYGHASSLIVWKNQVFVQYDTNDGGRVLSLNGQTGETIWDTKRNVNVSWASPILAEIDGNIQLIMSADPFVAGYDIETGKELWAVNCLYGEVGSSPAFSDGIVYAASEYARLAAIKPGPSPSILWEDDEYLPEVASPVASEGLLFVATTYGVLVCYDAKTGEKYWEQEFNNSFYSSPVIADGKLFATDINGITHIFKVSKTPELINEPELDETITTTPVFMDGMIYLRGDINLYCITQN